MLLRQKRILGTGILLIPLLTESSRFLHDYLFFLHLEFLHDSILLLRERMLSLLIISWSGRLIPILFVRAAALALHTLTVLALWDESLARGSCQVECILNMQTFAHGGFLGFGRPIVLSCLEL